MELAAAFAAPPLTPASRLPYETARTGAVQDVAGVAPTEDARAEAGTAANTSADRRLDRAAERVDEEREVLRRLTADDFAAIQEQLGLRPRPEDDTGFAGEVHPKELAEPRINDTLAVIDDDAQLTVRQTLDNRVDEPQDQQATDPSVSSRPDFSSAVADAVVTIDEYLAWVNEAGGQPR